MTQTWGVLWIDFWTIKCCRVKTHLFLGDLMLRSEKYNIRDLTLLLVRCFEEQEFLVMLAWDISYVEYQHVFSSSLASIYETCKIITIEHCWWGDWTIGALVENFGKIVNFSLEVNWCLALVWDFEYIFGAELGHHTELPWRWVEV